MGFQHPNQQAHKVQGIQRAIQSASTPAHLKPHLRNQIKELSNMKMVKGMPISGGKGQFAPKVTGENGKAAAMISTPPRPFKVAANTATPRAGMSNNVKPGKKSMFYGEK